MSFQVFECSILERGKDFLILSVPASFVRYGDLQGETTQKCQVGTYTYHIPL